jgi:hypothetical protein
VGVEESACYEDSACYEEPASYDATVVVPDDESEVIRYY